MSDFYQDDLYDLDDVFLGTPLLRPVRVNLSPSPSPPPLEDVRYNQFEDESDPNGWPFGQLELEKEDNSGSEDEVQEEIEVLPKANQESTGTNTAALDAVKLRQNALESAQNPRIPSIITGSPSLPVTAIECEVSSSPTTRELPLIIPASRDGNRTGRITLPSITDQLGDLNYHTEAAATSNLHGSPPRSQNDTFRRGRGQHSYLNDMTDGPRYTSANYYSSSDAETPSTDQSGSTPPIFPIDRMTIDGITSPQLGGFVCTYPGCTAQPFQTLYLLNTHRNVHSSLRSHYCKVKGCPRSEGGKGFKRKNEFIRHGLIHDSPGYVCPFCPDREHKYPRPDNLQRLVFSYGLIYHYGCR